MLSLLRRLRWAKANTCIVSRKKTPFGGREFCCRPVRLLFIMRRVFYLFSIFLMTTIFIVQIDSQLPDQSYIDERTQCRLASPQRCSSRAGTANSWQLSNHLLITVTASGVANNQSYKFQLFPNFPFTKSSPIQPSNLQESPADAVKPARRKSMQKLLQFDVFRFISPNSISLNFKV